MPDMHISAQLVSAQPAPAAALPLPGLPAEAAGPAAGAQTPDAFAALLAGRIGALDAPAGLAVAQAQAQAKTAKAGDAPAPGEDTTTLTAGLPATDAAAGTADKDKAASATEPADAQAPVQPGTPDATAQLLAVMGAMPQPAAAAPAPTAGPAPEDGAAVSGARTAAPADRPAQPTGPRGTGAAEDKPAKAEAAEPAGPKAPAAHASPAGAPEAPPPAAAPAAHAPQSVAPMQAASTPAGPAAPAPVVHMTVPGPVGTPLWREEFSASVSLLATQKVSSAELRMQPAELGPVQVSIRIEGGEANIACAAQHADTRHALEAALPRLREMLEANGLSVGNASVGQQNPGGGTAYDAPQGQARMPSGPDAGVAQAVPAAAAARASAVANRLVDVFA